MVHHRIALSIIFLVVPYTLTGQTAPQQPDTLDALKRDALKVYLDCPSCDKNYIRTEITYINYVRDRKEAQVHILVTTMSTASRGREYTFAFIGQQEFAGKDDTLKYISRQQDTADIIRAGIVQTLKLGLMYYVAKTPLAGQVAISFRQVVKPTAVVDKWDSWVFRTSVNSFYNGESSQNSLSVSGSVSADRITPELKITLRLNGSYRESNYTINDKEYSSFRRSGGFNGLIAKSISEHWSVGGRIRANSSSYSNIERETVLAPALEYNLFPYSQSTRRQLCFLYAVNYNPVQYLDTTIFNKTSESLFSESLDISLAMKEPWGSVRISLDGSHYFHDFSLYRVSLNGSLNLRLIKGFSLSLSGGASRIQDQLSLLKRQFSAEEILLGTHQLATDYSYFGSIGLSYTFGSIYSNVVNPRFGGGSSGGGMVIYY
ncbi:hypothetical protein ACFL4K_00850 [Candidatus Neomarinimicrobiota bacterium]